jgi:probable F420-dependent oxidoreductase|tara:strand:+ start:2181 stop:3167 length:987 start_codon:yes stop_codon:yes gene_type:complete
LKFGFEVPTSGVFAGPDSLARVARHGEQIGFDYLHIGDHLVIPRSIQSSYPYSDSGAFLGEWSSKENQGEDDLGLHFEQLTTLSYLAANTNKINLLSSVCILPYRQPVLTAKILATIDVLSNGRLIVGCGAGWMEEEFEALGLDTFKKRGSVTNEYIDAFRELWTSPNPTFKGEYVSFSDIYFAPKPIQKPYPPIWIGGESPAAIRRAANYGDVWYPFGNNPQYPLDTIDRLKNGIEKLNCKLDEADRDINKIGIALSAEMWYSDTDPIFDENGNRKLLTGEPSQVAEDIYNLAEIGVSYLTLDYKGTDIDETLYKMERFTKLVKALL